MTTDDLLQLLSQEYPNGVSFAPTALRLMRQRVQFEDWQIPVLKARMLRLGDGLWFSRDMIADAPTQRVIINKATTWLNEHGCFSIEQLFEGFQSSLRHVTTPEHYAAFLRHLGFKVAAWKRCGLFCFQPPLSLELRLAEGSRVIVELLDEEGGSLALDAVREAMPHLTIAALEGIRAQFLPEVIRSEVGGVLFWSCAEAITLPEDSAVEGDVIAALKHLQLEYVDKRNKGGALWVIGGKDLAHDMLKLKQLGYTFAFKPNGGRSTNYADSWWCSDAAHATNQRAKPSAKDAHSPSDPIDMLMTTLDAICGTLECFPNTTPIDCRIEGQVVEFFPHTWSNLCDSIANFCIVRGIVSLEGVLSSGTLMSTYDNPTLALPVIAKLCLHSNIQLTDVVVTHKPIYRKSTTLTCQSRPSVADCSSPAKPAHDPVLLAKLKTVLSTRFSNGYRRGSTIEMTRFRRFTEELHGETLSLSDEELEAHLATCGVIFEGKIYPVSEDAKARVTDIAEEYFTEGASAIFYSEFYSKHENWLYNASVVSVQMLREVFQRLFPEMSHRKLCFSNTREAVHVLLEKEILRVWGEELLLTYDQLAERLRYVPIDKIKYALGQNGDFIWNNLETFSHISRIQIPDKEHQAILNAAESECSSHGFVSVTQLPLFDILEHYSELSITGIHNAIYRICLSEKYDRKGKIVARKGDSIDVLSILKEFCRTKDKCSLDELLDLETEYTGQTHYWIALEAAYALLVRSDRETFVADKYVNFDVGSIDKAIKLFVREDYLPLKSLTTFAAFPDCGQTWNLYLLESYCRRFSRMFRFAAPSANSRNAGAVIQKRCGMDYTEIMADAVAKADIPVTTPAVSRFLYENGYTGKSTTAKAGQIIDMVKAIRKRTN